ncbi:hypothetical protein E2C01_035003 [Portunus trituberculatus]|uniref:Uncharacterized protein n=1 Tax=Portunus trituberculatus TaxID=210409 RepID=A0A5B7FAB0_PORTR|nr:hypothetical protein [Portunus trituberculatus]
MTFNSQRPYHTIALFLRYRVMQQHIQRHVAGNNSTWHLTKDINDASLAPGQPNTKTDTAEGAKSPNIDDIN